MCFCKRDATWLPPSGRCRASLRLEEALVAAHGDHSLESLVLGNVGSAALAVGHVDQAAALFERQRTAAQAAADKAAEVSALIRHLAHLATHGPDRAAALVHALKGIALAREVNDLSTEGELHWLAALTHDARGERDAALAHAESAVAVRKETQHPQLGWFIDQVERYRTSGNGTLGLTPTDNPTDHEPLESEDTPLPSPLGMALSATKALAKFAKAGFQTTSAAVQEEP